MHPDPAPYICAAALLSGALCSAILSAYYRAKLRRLHKLTWAAAERFYRLNKPANR